MTFSSFRTIKKTRKEHTCDGCGKQIAAGNSAFYWAGVVEGDFYHAYMHEDCRQAEEGWNDYIGGRGDDYEPLCCIGDDEEDGVEWLKEHFPVVAERMGFLKERTQ